MSKVSRAFFVQIAGLAVAGVIVAWLMHHFPVVDMILRAQRKVGQMKWWGAVLYPMLYGLCNLLLLPAGVLCMGSGLFFGLWWGFFLVLLGNVGGAAAAFWISRRLGRQWVEKKASHVGKWVALDDAIAREGWRIIFFSQVHPLFPSSLLNYMYGITRIPFGTCMMWIALGQAPGLFLYVYLGTLAQLGIRLFRGETHPLRMEYVIWIGGLVLTFVVTGILARIAMRILEDVEREAEGTKATIKGEPAPASGSAF